MRGEKTQIAGFLAARPDFDGVLCLPDTHSKWVRISAGEICHFQTLMTGEMFDLLARYSVLRHSVGGATPQAGADFTGSVAMRLASRTAPGRGFSACGPRGWLHRVWRPRRPIPPT